ncbi:hypothetical protein [Aquihabitans sp. McL0605]|uniref:hypothetical protein n=1 Tax=Aquihabitans sp. McL0605 TaxID=3415671 RepID=UPI003CF60CE1
MTDRPLLIDDHLLLRVLLADEPASLREGGAQLFTTGLWYHRLGRALSDQAVTGSMSRRLGSAPPALAAEVVAAVASLPATIGLVSLRELAWPMAGLVAAGAHLNLLSLEALAAARHLGAEICLARADDNPPLSAAAEAADIGLRVIDR